MNWTDSSEVGVGATLASGAEFELAKHRSHKCAAPAEILAADEPGAATQLHDRVIGHLFGSRLMLASIVSLGKVETEVAERLRYVLDELEAAVRDIRRNDFVLSVRDHEPGAAEHPTTSNRRPIQLNDQAPPAHRFGQFILDTPSNCAEIPRTDRASRARCVPPRRLNTDPCVRSRCESDGDSVVSDALAAIVVHEHPVRVTTTGRRECLPSILGIV